MASAWAEDGTELVELHPGKPIMRAILVGTELLLQRYMAIAEPGLTWKKGVIQVLTNKYSYCICLTSLTEICH